MMATLGSDTNGPIEYFFSEISDNPGGDDSNWQTSAIYIDNGLDPNTQYIYTVQMRDSVGNYSNVSEPNSAITTSEIPLNFEVSDEFIGATYCVGLAVGDINADGNLDIASGCNYKGNWIVLNNGNGTFDHTYYEPVDYRQNIELVDFDQDGDLDYSWGAGGLMNNNGTFEATSS